MTSSSETGHKSEPGKSEVGKSEVGKSEVGKKGVSQETVGSGKDKDPNNFANDKERAAASGKKGGHTSH